MADPVIIAAFARTPMGGFLGALSGASAPELGAAAVRATVKRAGVPSKLIEGIFMGCVLPAGLGQAPARQAALGAGLPLSVQATTINKMCGSGMQAAILASDALAAGSFDLLIAGGVERKHIVAQSDVDAALGREPLAQHPFQRPFPRVTGAA